MKILELRFKNLNSLYGEWIIDFTDPAYAAEGIFTLTGPTGAGKSTILDAICLALYGATPRLKKITKSENEIMSRLTGECYSEVLFETREGRFRCHWVQRRARKHHSGNLQDYEHQIVEDETQTIITAKKSEVPSVVEEKTGMDFTRFTRAILLAQGSFDSFLKADDEGKSLILEQITGTDIYSKISIAVYERNKKESEKLDSLRGELAGINVLDIIQEQTLRQDLEAKLAEETGLSSTLKKCTEALSWLSGMDSLTKEIVEIDALKAKKLQEIEAFAPQRLKLENARRAANIEAVYSPVTVRRKQLAEDEVKLGIQEKALPLLVKSADDLSAALLTAEKYTTQTRDNITIEAPIWSKIKLLDQQIVQMSTVVTELTQSCLKETSAIEEKQKERSSEVKKRDNEVIKLEKATAYIAKHASDEMLISELGAISEQCRNIIDLQTEISAKASEILKTEKAVSDGTRKLETILGQRKLREKEIEETINKKQIIKDELKKLLGEKLLREYRAEKDSLQKEFTLRMTIASLEEHRSKLEDGIACPLCGSLEHPFASGNVPESDDVKNRIEKLQDLIRQSEELEEVIRLTEITETENRNLLSTVMKLETEVEIDKKSALQTLENLKNDLEKLNAREEMLLSELSTKLGPLGITEFKVQTLPSILKERKTAYENQITLKNDCQKQIDYISGEIKRFEAVIENLESTRIEKNEHLRLRKEEHIKLETERKRLYGDKNPVEEEARFNKLLEQAMETEKKSRNQLDLKKQELTGAKTQIDSLKGSISGGTEELKKCEVEFAEALKAAGFHDESEFLGAMLPSIERTELVKKDDALKSVLFELNTKMEDRKTRLDVEKERKLTEKNASELRTLMETLEKDLTSLRNDITELKFKLRGNEEAKSKMSSSIAALKAQENEAARWNKLNTLIGSSNGKKFRHFAQGLTFEILAGHANEQLKNMTDRYLLIRDENKPLELNVIDNYQAGERRSIKNLSGGESFIVSLALALGLSQMSSGKILVESLFLDEGFGTLDDEALESALETLSTLQQSGKLIGIISHLSVLKERISTTIMIKPITDGRSTISGPGCRNIDLGSVSS
ncbi:AAA family ATPase [Myxococcota bacterium]|nr:AAA family ATPase [Myxococcota bacterium]MBU1379580.1 AAA family ATPase [Myxococcota bacterium]MBU1496821.1 AAA family ATPase [Myxococcota bacterium]